jgi:cobalamin biosynthesis Mg chelatase CobN
LHAFLRAHLQLLAGGTSYTHEMPLQLQLILPCPCPCPILPYSNMQEFLAWCERLHSYLQTLENRLFSEGLHVLGAPPSSSQMAQYLGAYYGDSLPPEAVEVLAEGRGVDAARAALEAAWQQVGGAALR